MNINNLITIKHCPFKGYIQSFNLKAVKSKYFIFADIYKTIIKDSNFKSMKDNEIKGLISEYIKEADSFFLTEQEKDVELNIIYRYLLRYKKYLVENNCKILNVDVFREIQGVKVKADIIYQTKETIEIVKIKSGKPKLSYKARKEENKPESQEELYLLRELGKILYPDAKVISSFHHMRGKSDEKEHFAMFLRGEYEELKNLLEVFEAELEELESIKKVSDKNEEKEISKAITAVKKQVKAISEILGFSNNIISYFGERDLKDEVKKIVELKLGFESEKCESGECERCEFKVLCKYEPKKEVEYEETIKEKTLSKKKINPTEKQVEVINAKDGYYVVQAFAGSGKTSTLALRIVELIKTGVNPSQILLIAYTENAKLEMIEKLIEVGMSRSNPVEIVTFNSFGDKLIKQNYERLGFSKEPTLINSVENFDIIQEVLAEYKQADFLDYKNPLLRTLYAEGCFFRFQSLYKDYIYGKELDLTSVQLEYLKQMIKSYKGKMKAKNLIDYTDQTILPLTELEIKGYEAIIVDEWQDVSSINYQLILKMIKHPHNKSLMVVGDRFQSIYSFNYSDPEIMTKKIYEDIENVKTITLPHNFRSTKEICRLANGIFKDGEVSMITPNPNGNISELEQLDKKNFYKTIAERIKNSKYSPEEVMYLGRTRKSIIEMAKELTLAEIPFVAEVAIKYIDDIGVQQIVNLAKYFLSTDLEYYLFENLIVNNHLTKDKICIGSISGKLRDKLEILSEEGKIDLFYALTDKITEVNFIAKEFIEKLQEDRVFYTFRGFLEYLTKIMLYQDASCVNKQDKKYKAVKLRTFHGSKGSQEKYVVLDLSSMKTVEDEQLRLLYVGVTRAELDLSIFYHNEKNKFLEFLK